MQEGEHPRAISAFIGEPHRSGNAADGHAGRGGRSLMDGGSYRIPKSSKLIISSNKIGFAIKLRVKRTLL